GPVQPAKGVAQFPAGVLNRTGHPVERAGAPERREVRAGLRYAQHGLPKRNARHSVVPRLAHEPKPVGRVGHDAVEAVRIERGHDLLAGADVDHRASLGSTYRRPASDRSHDSAMYTSTMVRDCASPTSCTNAAMMNGVASHETTNPAAVLAVASL